MVFDPWEEQLHHAANALASREDEDESAMPRVQQSGELTPCEFCEQSGHPVYHLGTCPKVQRLKRRSNPRWERT